MLSLLSQFAQSSVDYSYNYSASPATTGAAAAIMLPIFIVAGIFSVFIIVSAWKTYVKAGRPGWAAIIPIYNSWVLLEMGGKPGWWALVAFIPFVNIVAVVFMILAIVEMCKRFGKGAGFAILTIFIPIIAYPILAFGKAEYHDPEGGVPTATPGAGAPVAPQAPAAPVAPDPSVPPQPQTPPTNPTPPTPPTPPTNLIQ